MSMMRLSVVFLILGSVSSVAAQSPCNFERMEEKIDILIKKHQNSAENKEFAKIGSFYVEGSNDTPANTLSGVKPFIFLFAPGRTFRFYVVTQGIDAQVKLLQHPDGLLKKKESLTLFERTQMAEQINVGFYDYYLEEENEFQLLFLPGNSNEGCALMKFVEIAPQNQ